jgi:hypothetical protein
MTGWVTLSISEEWLSGNTYVKTKTCHSGIKKILLQMFTTVYNTDMRQHYVCTDVKEFYHWTIANKFQTLLI